MITAIVLLGVVALVLAFAQFIGDCLIGALYRRQWDDWGIQFGLVFFGVGMLWLATKLTA